MVCYTVLLKPLYYFSDGAKGIPDIEVSESDPIPGEKVTFTCSEGNMTANPDVDQVKWTKDGEKVKKASFQYDIDEVLPEHNGTYECQLGNKHGFSNFSDSVVLSVNFSAFCKYI